MKKVLWTAICILLVAIVGAGIYIGLVKFEWEKPAVQLTAESRFITKQLVFKVSDQKSGVAEIKVEVIQQGRSIPIHAEQVPKGTHVVERALNMRPLPKGLKDGEATVKISAWDYSWNHGNPVAVEKNVLIDTQPPQVSVLGAQHYINQGGAGLITFTSSEELAVSGIKVGDLFFTGRGLGKDKYLAYFALLPEAPRDTVFTAVGEDQAGNRTQVGFRPIIKAKAFRKDKIQISDGFLKQILPYFTERDANLKGTPVEIFLYLNQKQREIDHQQIRKICQETDPQPLWSGTFLRFPNSKPMASFAEERTYVYDGKEIDRQTHLGVDLASLAQSPVPAANSGRVAFAGPLGIYGNTVMVDHGCGLFSMYSHLSRIETEAKKEVKKGDILGRSGSTGMAGGDHLHYAMLIQGVFINPIEWWDEHWIHDNIELKMKLWESPALSETSQPTTPPLKAVEPKGKSKRTASKAKR